jgi:ribonuclease HII
MVVASVAADSADLPAGIDDSKNLAPARRKEFAATLHAHDEITVGVVVVPTDRIDAPGMDMNSLTVEAHAEAISQVVGGAEEPSGEQALDEPVSGIADACDTDEQRFAGRVEENATVPVDVTAEHGADETHAVVGAASVVAKVERDAHVARIAEKHGDVGSGYPGDPKTRDFLREYLETHGELPDCARTSWSTCDDLLAAHEQSGLDQF